MVAQIQNGKICVFEASRLYNLDRQKFVRVLISRFFGFQYVIIIYKSSIQLKCSLFTPSNFLDLFSSIRQVCQNDARGKI